MSGGVGEINRAQLFHALVQSRGTRAREALDAIGVNIAVPRVRRRWIGKARLGPQTLVAIDLAAAEASREGKPAIDSGHLLAALARGPYVGHDICRDPIVGASRVLSAWPDQVVLWDLEGSGLQSLPAPATCVAADLWWRQVATGDGAGTLRILDFESGEQRSFGQGSAIRAVAWCPTEPLLLSAHEDGTALIWDAQRGEVVHALHNHIAAINTVTFDATGERAYTGSDDHTIRVWDPRTGMLLDTLTEHAAPVLRLGFIAPEAPLTSRSADNIAISWGEPRQTQTLPPDEVGPILQEHGLSAEAIRRAIA
jgi:hypothetical protein